MKENLKELKRLDRIEKENEEIINPNISKLKVVSKDEYINTYMGEQFRMDKPQNKEEAIKSFDKVSKGHEFVFMLPIKNGTSSYSVDYIDDMLRR